MTKPKPTPKLKTKPAGKIANGATIHAKVRSANGLTGVVRRF